GIRGGPGHDDVVAGRQGDGGGAGVWEKRRYDAVGAEARIEIAVGRIPRHGKPVRERTIGREAHDDYVAAELDGQTCGVEIQSRDPRCHDAIEAEPQVLRAVRIELFDGEIKETK